jgi:hypothetical protein
VFTNDPSCSKPNTFAVILSVSPRRSVPRTALKRGVEAPNAPPSERLRCAKANLPNSSAWHPEDACSGNMLVLIRWQDRDVAEFRIHETSRNLPGDWM